MCTSKRYDNKRIVTCKPKLQITNYGYSLLIPIFGSPTFSAGGIDSVVLGVLRKDHDLRRRMQYPTLYMTMHSTAIHNEHDTTQIKRRYTPATKRTNRAQER
jgi:hypothetical protein